MDPRSGAADVDEAAGDLGVLLSLGLIWLVSGLTWKAVPVGFDAMMLRLHAPEERGLSRDHISDAHISDAH